MENNKLRLFMHQIRQFIINQFNIHYTVLFCSFWKTKDDNFQFIPGLFPFPSPVLASSNDRLYFPFLLNVGDSRSWPRSGLIEGSLSFDLAFGKGEGDTLWPLTLPSFLTPSLNVDRFTEVRSLSLGVLLQESAKVQTMKSQWLICVYCEFKYLASRCGEIWSVQVTHD